MTIRKHIRKLRNDLLFRPWGVRIGTDSFVRRPFIVLERSRVSIGTRTSIYDNAIITPISFRDGVYFDPAITIGDDVHIGRYVFIAAIKGVEIGSGSVLSEYVYVSDSLHGIDPRKGLIMKQPLSSKGPIRIGRNCFLGFRTAVMPGVVLGDHCVVGINSVVTKSFPAYSMLAGSPANLIKVYSPETGLWESVPDREKELG